MKTKSRIMAALVMLAFGAVPALGGTGMTFLTLGVGGRSLGMGEAYSTGAADPAAMQYNPASLSSIGITMVSLMHRSWIQGTNAEYIAGAFSFGKFSMGLSTYWLSIRDIEVRTVPGSPISTFTAQDLSVGFSAAYELTDEISVGLTGKYLYEKILLDDAGGMAFDFGGVYATPSGIRVGAAIANLGSVSALKDESTPLPKIFRGGISYTTTLQNPATTITG
ncbi:MAG TPA: PorV/PorQ family protein, partial [Bacteroidota bacterium]|nr:PorV/PorQ family protein [Bacteroidota bacterium]